MRKQKKRFTSENRPGSPGRKDDKSKHDVGLDAKALWSELVFDVLQQDHSCEGLVESVKQFTSLPTLTFLKELDSFKDLIANEFFKRSLAAADFGRDEARVDLASQLEGLLCAPESLVTIVRYADRAYGSNPIRFLGACYQIASFPLRIDIGEEIDCDYGKLVQINESRDRFAPSQLLKDIAAEFIDEEFMNSVYRGFKPKHGPGSVAFRDNNRVKTRRMDPVSKDNILEIGRLATMCDAAGLQHPYMYEELRQSQSEILGPVPSVVTAVPKSWKKRRIIAIEDATTMYFAKGVQAGLYRALAESRSLRRFINLTNAEENRDLARFGSLTGAFSTVDLSSASDSIGEKFVRELFGEDHPLWRILRQARPRKLFVPGYGVVENHIFATMGNAVCFPILTLVVFFILVEACRLSNLNLDDTSLHVYGDDAVCPRGATECFKQLLTSYGFEVNNEKTFSHLDPFRESCGGEYLRGVEITPVRLPRSFHGMRLGRGFENFTQLVSLANELYLRRYSRCYRAVCRILSSFGYIPFTRDGSIGLAHVLPRTCMQHYPQIQVVGFCSEWYVVQVRLAHPRKALRGLVGLREWLWQHDSEPEEPMAPHFSQIGDPSEPRTVAPGFSPGEYHRARCLFNASQVYLSSWKVEDGVTNVLPIEPSLVEFDEDLRWALP